ncbi:IMP cyclohydrolase, partial [Lacticaseibacillus rhamnosus]|nr:IMP cyclohydrolase [Lacticaseibacillus rhamnosus]MCT3371528.1 IMP cyclohydrolase [Lacticaseibacillus rhamnosus]
CKDLKRNGQDRAITLKAAYTPTSNRAGSRSHKKRPTQFPEWIFFNEPRIKAW